MSKNKKVLIVDDDPDILEALELTFEEAGYLVQSLTNGDDMDTSVKEFAPDAIILDVFLSGKDGRVLCKQLKSDDATKHIPFIMISAQPDALQSVKAAGAEEFLAKPFDIEEIVRKVEKYTSSL